LPAGYGIFYSYDPAARRRADGEGLSMRRLLACGVLAALAGCSGAGEFLSDTHGWNWTPNMPAGASETIERVQGSNVEPAPLLPEQGDIWPSAIPQVPTLADIQQQENSVLQQPLPGESGNKKPRQKGSPDGSSTPPGSNQPGLAPGAAPSVEKAPSAGPSANSGVQQFQYPSAAGSELGVPSNSGKYDVLTAPNGSNGGIVVPNGNGTSTVILPNGTIRTVPTPHQQQ
jgi:hypothetical protein